MAQQEQYAQANKGYMEWTRSMEERAEKSRRENIKKSSIENCGEALGPFVSEYLLAFFRASQGMNDQSREILREKRAELAEKFVGFSDSQRGTNAWLFVGEMQARIAAGSFDPKPDYK